LTDTVEGKEPTSKEEHEGKNGEGEEEGQRRGRRRGRKRMGGRVCAAVKIP